MKAAPIALLLILAACAATPVQREMQYATGIKTAQQSLVTALDFDLVTPSDAERIQALTRTATADLKRAVQQRRAGAPQSIVYRILDTVLAAIVEANRLLAERK